MKPCALAAASPRGTCSAPKTSHAPIVVALRRCRVSACVQIIQKTTATRRRATRRKKIKNSENTTVFPRPLAWRPHRRIDHRLRGYLSGAPSWSRKGRYIDAIVLLMQLNYDLLTDFELPLAPGPGRGRFQTPAKAPTLKYFLTKEIVGRASG